MHFIIFGNRFRKQQKQLFTGHIASQQLSYRPLLFHPNIFSMQFDKDASFFIIKFIFERVMRTVNGRVPTVQTHQIGQTAFQSILRLNYSGVTILGEPAETQYAARVNVMVKTLTYWSSCELNYTRFDIWHACTHGDSECRARGWSSKINWDEDNGCNQCFVFWIGLTHAIFGYHRCSSQFSIGSRAINWRSSQETCLWQGDRWQCICRPSGFPG